MTFAIPFDAQHVARAIRVPPDAPPAEALARLDLPPFRAMIVVHGGASAMEPQHAALVRTWAAAALAPLADAHAILVVDGGTDTGTGQALGAARQTTGARFPLLGVVPEGCALYPGGPPPEAQRIRLNPWHTHFALVEGSAFGVESALLVGLLGAVPVPGLALVVNGGQIVLDEVHAQAGRGQRLVALRGSGRAADALANPSSPERQALPPGTRIDVVEADLPDQFRVLVEGLFSPRPPSSR